MTDPTATTATEAWHLYRDGEHVAGPFPTHIAAIGELHRRVGYSAEHAVRYEGWELRRETTSEETAR